MTLAIFQNESSHRHGTCLCSKKTRKTWYWPLLDYYFAACSQECADKIGVIYNECRKTSMPTLHPKDFPLPQDSLT